MRKLILFNMVSLEGYVAGPNGEIDWHVADEEFNQYSVQQLQTAGGLLFGRVTYELMASYWPTAVEDPAVADMMNRLPKVAFSRTLAQAEWQNTRLVNENAAGVVTNLKKQPGKDLFLFGSAGLASTLIENMLIDEFRLLVAPLALGSGMPLFKVKQPLALNLLQTRAFRNGSVLLTYRLGADIQNQEKNA